MRQFKVLPTDERFQSLLYEEKVAIFEGFNYIAEDELLKQYITLTSKKEELEKKDPVSFLPDAAVRSMRHTFKKSGMKIAEINKHLRRQGEIKKQADIKQVQDQLDTFLGKKTQKTPKGPSEEVARKRANAIKRYYGSEKNETSS